MPFVLDCSMAMAWVFSDEATEATDALRDRLLDDRAVVPALWSWEVGNVLWAATRRKRIERHDWLMLTTALAALPIEIDPEGPARVLTAVLPLAEEHALSVYDAAYLELAIRRRIPLATLDRALQLAARTVNLPSLPTS